MSRDRMYTEKSVIVARGPETGRDRYNQPVYGAPVRIEAPCWYTHQASTEDNATGPVYAESYLIQWPARYHDAVRGADTVEVPPIGTFTVAGEPLYQPAGFVVAGYVRATLERGSGNARS